MSKFNIRRADANDIEPLVEFNQGIAIETEDFELDRDTLRAGILQLLENDQYGFYIVAECEGRVAGCLMITYEWSDWRNAVFWWIQSVYVHADFRRQGVYRSLYQHIQQMAREHNVCGFRLYVEKENTVAQRTYEKLGMNEAVYLMYQQKNET